MRTLEKEGKTIDEAIWRGLQDLDLPRENVRIEILDEGSKGLFGIGGRPAKVLLIELEVEEELDIKGFMRSSEVATKGRSSSKNQGRAATRLAPDEPRMPATEHISERSAAVVNTPPSNRGEYRGGATESSLGMPPQDDIARKIAQQLQ